MVNRRTAISAREIFTGNEGLHDHAVIINKNLIEAVVPTTELPNDISIHHHDGLLAPSLIDIQIYGAHGRLLAVFPTKETLHEMYRYCSAGGANFFLPTVATNSYAVIEQCIEAVRSYRNAGGEGVLGLHVEGPWISKEKRGAHIEEFIHAPTLQQVQQVLDKGKGIIKMITLAPEVCSAEVVDCIQQQGIIVSAGHSNASYAQATAAFDNGINAATHLYNAMSGLNHRAPGMVGAILNHSSVMASIVPDGYHVDFAAIAIAKKIMRDRLFIITDAVTTTTEGLYQHQLAGDKYEAGGILSGSALTMIKGVKNCVEHAGIRLHEALRMASVYPAKVLQMSNRLGTIAAGRTAVFTYLDDALNVCSPTKK